MAVTYGFFNANLVEGDYDRKYTADQLAEFFSYLLGNGISASIDDNFEVTPSSGLSISVAAGFAWIKGFWVKNDASFELTDTVVPSSGYRKDLVVLRFNRTDRTISPMIIQGEVAQVAPATIPTYKRTAGEYDLVLAMIDIEAGDSAITSEMITDLRTDETYCGIVDTFSARLIPTGSVQTDTLADHSVTTIKLALLAVTEACIDDGAVTNAKIHDGAVTRAKIGDNAVNGDKIAAGSVTAAKLGSDILPANVGIRMGTADPTTTTCPQGCIYLKYSS